MPYAVVIWKRGTNTVDIAGLKPDDLEYLEKIPCLSARLDVDSEGRTFDFYLSQHTIIVFDCPLIQLGIFHAKFTEPNMFVVLNQVSFDLDHPQRPNILVWNLP